MGSASNQTRVKNPASSDNLVFDEVSSGDWKRTTADDLRRWAGNFAVASMQDLLNEDLERYGDGDSVYVRNFYPDVQGGGDPFDWDANGEKGDHDGIMTIDPTHSTTPGNAGWWDSENTGTTGVFRRREKGYIDARDAGIKDSTSDRQQEAFQAILDVLAGGGGEIIVPDIEILIGSSDGTYTGFDLTNHAGLTIRGLSKGKSRILNDYTTDNISIFNIKSENVTIENLYFYNTTATGKENFSKYGIKISNGANKSTIKHCSFEAGMLFGTPGDTSGSEVEELTLEGLSFYDCEVAPCELVDMYILNASNFYFKNSGGLTSGGESQALTASGLKEANLSNFIFEDSHGFKLQGGNFDCYDVNVSNFIIKSRPSATNDKLVLLDGLSNPFHDINLSNIVINTRSEVTNVVQIRNAKDLNIDSMTIDPVDGETVSARFSVLDSDNVQLSNISAEDVWIDTDLDCTKTKLHQCTFINKSNFLTAEFSGKKESAESCTFYQLNDSDTNINIEGDFFTLRGGNIIGGSVGVFAEGQFFTIEGATLTDINTWGVRPDANDCKILNNTFNLAGDTCIRITNDGVLVKNNSFKNESDNTKYSLTSDISSSASEPTITIASADMDNFELGNLVVITDDDSSNWNTHIIGMDKYNDQLTLAGTSPSAFTQAQNATINKPSSKSTTAIDQGASDFHYVINNDFDSALSGYAPNTNEVVYGNKNFVTENRGTSSITSGNTSTTVSHGLDYTPSIEDINVNANSSLGSASYWYIDSVTSSQFNINVDTDPAATVNFSWKASRNT